MKKKDNILRLKYRLEPKENDMVEFQVLEQDERIYKILKVDSFHCENDWSVKSVHAPAIYPFTEEIFVRGYSELQKDRVCEFDGHDTIPSIHKALEEMVKKVFGNCTVIKS